MRLRRARTRTRRLPETLPLACHDAVSGAPRATWENTRVERRSTRVREEASGTGSGALVLRQWLFGLCAAARLPAMIFWPHLTCSSGNARLGNMFAIVVASGHGCRHHHCHHHRYQHQVAAAILVVIIAISATPLLVVLFIFGGHVYCFGVVLFSFYMVLFRFILVFLFIFWGGPVITSIISASVIIIRPRNVASY